MMWRIGGGTTLLGLVGGIIFIQAQRESWPPFYVNEIIINGLQRTSRSEILKALPITRGDSIWKVSLAEIEQRLIRLPWAQTVLIQRRLPWTLKIEFTEKKPMAIWQNQGIKKVIDEKGNPISSISPTLFPNLLHVTGEEAPLHLPDFLKTLEAISTLIPIRAASFLRSQRWDLYTHKGQLMKLPQDPHKILEPLMCAWPLVKDALSIDLRFPKTIIFEPGP